MPSETANLLIVEDEAVVARLLEMTALDAGLAEVLVARTASEALMLAERQPPEVVIMDVSLESRMAGLEAARRLSERYRAAIIFLSGNPWLQETCLALQGNVQFLQKPFLRTEIEDALGRARSDRAAM